MRQIPLTAWIGLILTGMFLICAVFAPWIAPYGNGEIVGDVWAPMSSTNVLGTDNLGRDLLSRMIYGARITIFIAVLATALAFCLGSILGFTAATVGGKFDMILSRFVDLLMAIPTLIFALVVLSVLPSTIVTLILVMGILDSTASIASRARSPSTSTSWISSKPPSCAAKAWAGSSSGRSCPMHCRP